MKAAVGTGAVGLSPLIDKMKQVKNCFFNKEKNLNSQELSTVYSLRVFTDDKHLSAQRIVSP